MSFERTNQNLEYLSDTSNITADVLVKSLVQFLQDIQKIYKEANGKAIRFDELRTDNVLDLVRNDYALLEMAVNIYTKNAASVSNEIIADKFMGIESDLSDAIKKLKDYDEQIEEKEKLIEELESKQKAIIKKKEEANKLQAECDILRMQVEQLTNEDVDGLLVQLKADYSEKQSTMNVFLNMMNGLSNDELNGELYTNLEANEKKYNDFEAVKKEFKKMQDEIQRKLNEYQTEYKKLSEAMSKILKKEVRE